MKELFIDFLSKELLKFPWYPLGNYVASIFVRILMLTGKKLKKTTKNKMKEVALPGIYGTALMQRRTRSKYFARHTLALHIYHLESSSLQLKNRSTLGLQQKLYKARLFYLKTICYKTFHRFKYVLTIASTRVSLNVRSIMPSIVLFFVEIT